MWKASLILILLGSGCVNGTPGSLDALCQGTRDARTKHAAALAVDENDAAVVTGLALIERIDAACR